MRKALALLVLVLIWPLEITVQGHDVPCACDPDPPLDSKYIAPRGPRDTAHRSPVA